MREKDQIQYKIVPKQIEEYIIHVNVLLKSYFYANCAVRQNKQVFV